MSGPLISFADVSFAYPNQSTPVLMSFSHAVVSGRMIGVVGQSGCGKSTLIRLITGRLRPRGGHIALHASVDPRRHGHYGLVTQTDGLFPWRSVESNILAAFPEAASDEQRAGLHENLEALGLSPAVLRNFPFQLSIGMRKRVELCRAVLRPSPLTLADEPFAALDVASAAAARRWLISKVSAAGGTLLLVSHDLRIVAEFCQEILIFRYNAPGLVEAVQNPVVGLPPEDPRATDFRVSIARSIGAL